MNEMPSRLDDMSRTMGIVEAKIEGLEQRTQEDRQSVVQEGRRRDQIASDRHAENQASIASVRVLVGELSDSLSNKLAGNAQQIAMLAVSLDEHAEAVTTMRPQLAALQASRSKMMFYASIGMAVLAAMGVAAEAALKSGVTWVLTKF